MYSRLRSIFDDAHAHARAWLNEIETLRARVTAAPPSTWRKAGRAAIWAGAALTIAGATVLLLTQEKVADVATVPGERT